MRNEVKKNRDISKNRIGLELNEKKKKLDQMDRLLSEPPITMNELNALEN
jgi:intraflagellar transport protein 81